MRELEHHQNLEKKCENYEIMKILKFFVKIMRKSLKALNSTREPRNY